MDTLAEFLTNIFIILVILIGMAAIVLYPTQSGIERTREHWKEVDRQGVLLLETIKGSGWSLEDISNLPLVARQSMIEQLDLDYDIVCEFIDTYFDDNNRYAEVNEELHDKWMPQDLWADYRVTRQYLRRVPKNDLTRLPK